MLLLQLIGNVVPLELFDQNEDMDAVEVLAEDVDGLVHGGR